MTITQQIIMVAAGVAATVLTRFLPFLVFRPGKPTPGYIRYLGSVLPAAVFALLVVYCLRYLPFGSDGNLSFVLSADSVAQLAAVGLTVAVHVWRRNLMWSIVAGTASYMLLLRIMP